MTFRIGSVFVAYSMFTACVGPEPFKSQGSGIGVVAGATGQPAASGAAGNDDNSVAGTIGGASDNGSGGAGTTGVAGANVVGVVGPTGTAGMSIGTAGAAGTAGTGANSAAGSTGTAGTTDAGATAGAGTTSAAGTTGTAGTTGATRISGSAGVTGAAGTGPVFKIDAGGTISVADFVADTDFTGGMASSHLNTIDTSGVANPAPAVVYQTSHTGVGVFTYTIPGYVANSGHTIRLHFCETYFPVPPATIGPGQRTCDISINGKTVLANYDIFVKAGAKNKAVVEQFRENASGAGQFVLQFSPTKNNCFIAGIEIL